MEVLCETDFTADISEMSLRVSSALCSSATSSVELEVTGLAVQPMFCCVLSGLELEAGLEECVASEVTWLSKI